MNENGEEILEKVQEVTPMLRRRRVWLPLAAVVLIALVATAVVYTQSSSPHWIGSSMATPTVDLHAVDYAKLEESRVESTVLTTESFQLVLPANHWAALTCGQVTVNGVRRTNYDGHTGNATFLPSNPDAEATTYELTQLLPSAHCWLGVYVGSNPDQSQLSDSTSMVSAVINAFHHGPNCSGGHGCQNVDALFIGPGGSVESRLIV